MKRTLGIALAAVALLAVTACGTGSAAGAPQGPVGAGIPPGVMQYIINAPEGVLVGIGTANMPTPAGSLQFARTRAMTHIAQQLGTLVNNMVTDYMAMSEITQDAIDFQESITQTLTRQEVTGAVPTYVHNVEGTNIIWAVYTLDRSRTTQTVNDAVAALNPGFGAAMGAIDRMDRAFDRLSQDEIGFVGN